MQTGEWLKGLGRQAPHGVVLRDIMGRRCVLKAAAPHVHCDCGPYANEVSAALHVKRHCDSNEDKRGAALHVRRE